MTINLYSISEDPLTMPKTLPEPTVMTGTIRDNQVDVMHPTILMSGAPSQTYNYAYLPDFGRYYFVDPPITDRTGLIRLQLHVDVLQSFYDDIMSAAVIVDRTQNATALTPGWNSYLQDPRRAFYQYTLPQYITLGDIGRPSSILIVTAG